MIAVFVVMAVFVIGSVILGLFAGELSAIILAAILLIVILLGMLLNKAACRKVSAGINIIENSGKEGDIVIEILLENKGVLPIFKGKYFVTAENKNFKFNNKFKGEFSLPGYSSKTQQVVIRSNYCGKYEITIDSVRCMDVWGITYRSIIKNEKSSACLFPKARLIGRVTEVVKMSYEKEKKFAGRKSPNLSDILQYRDYEKGDNLKNVNWKLSVKFDKLLVREFDTPIDNRTLIIFDIGQGDIEYQNLTYSVLFSISMTCVHYGMSHQIAWKEEGRLEMGNIESMDDLFRVMRRVLTADIDENVSSAVLFDSSERPEKYARIQYVTNNVTGATDNIIRKWGNGMLIPVEPKYFSDETIMTDLKRLEI